MFATGFAIFFGLLFLFIKLPRRIMLRWLRYDLLLDVAVSVLVLCVHWGSFEGVIAATFAGLLTSVGTSCAKRLFGFIKGDIYHPGLIRLAV